MAELMEYEMLGHETLFMEWKKGQKSFRRLFLAGNRLCCNREKRHVLQKQREEDRQTQIEILSACLSEEKAVEGR